MKSQTSWFPLVFWLPSLSVLMALRAGAAEPSVSQPPLAGVSTAHVEVKRPDVVYVPTPQELVDKMLEMAEVKPWDVVYDLGCGDGRVVVTAAKRYGVKAKGVDIDPKRVEESLANIRANKVDHLVTVEQKDIFTLDLSEATVVFLYLLPELNVRLMPQLEKLRPGSRIVSHDFSMRGAKPVEVVTLTVETVEAEVGDFFDDGMHTIYKWVVPWEKEELPQRSEQNKAPGGAAK